MKRRLLAGLVMLTAATWALAGGQPTEQDLKNANNPLADLTAFNIQNYYKSDLIGLGDATANTAWLRCPR